MFAGRLKNGLGEHKIGGPAEGRTIKRWEDWMLLAGVDEHVGRGRCGGAVREAEMRGARSGGAGRKGAACACCLRAASWLPLLVCCGALGAQRCCRRVTARPPSSSRPSSIGGMQTLHAAARQANACCTC